MNNIQKLQLIKYAAGEESGGGISALMENLPMEGIRRGFVPGAIVGGGAGVLDLLTSPLINRRLPEEERPTFGQQLKRSLISIPLLAGSGGVLGSAVGGGTQLYLGADDDDFSEFLGKVGDRFREERDRMLGGLIGGRDEGDGEETE